jgi:methyl-accepting chemotaxis protein
MMEFRGTSLKRRLVGVILLTASVVLLFTSAAFVTYEWITVRQQTQSHVRAVAHLIAANSTAALDYDVRQDAMETLGSLAAEGSITAAALYNANGELFATFPPGETAHLPPTAEAEGFRTAGSAWEFVMAVRKSGKIIGTLYLRYSLEPVYKRFALYGCIVALVMVSSFALAYIVSNSLQRRISTPILALADTARHVSHRKDFSVRAQKFSDDELGLLTDAFNEMLGEIHDRDVALLESQERLLVALAAADMGTWRMDAKSRMNTRDANLNRMLGLPAMESTHPFDEFLSR